MFSPRPPAPQFASPFTSSGRSSADTTDYDDDPGGSGAGDVRRRRTTSTGRSGTPTLRSVGASSERTTAAGSFSSDGAGSGGKTTPVPPLPVPPLPASMTPSKESARSASPLVRPPAPPPSRSPSALSLALSTTADLVVPPSRASSRPASPFSLPSGKARDTGSPTTTTTPAASGRAARAASPAQQQQHARQPSTASLTLLSPLSASSPRSFALLSSSSSSAFPRSPLSPSSASTAASTPSGPLAALTSALLRPKKSWAKLGRRSASSSASSSSASAAQAQPKAREDDRPLVPPPSTAERADRARTPSVSSSKRAAEGSLAPGGGASSSSLSIPLASWTTASSSSAGGGGSSLQADAQRPLKRQPSRLFLTLRKASLPLFTSPPTPASARGEDDMDVGRPFNCQHELHVGVDDLSALPAEWVAQLKAKGLSSAELLKLAKDKSASVRAREGVPTRAIESVDFGPPDDDDDDGAAKVSAPLADVVGAGRGAAERELPPAPLPSAPPSPARLPSARATAAAAAARPSLPPFPLLAAPTPDSPDAWAQGLLGAFPSSSSSPTTPDAPGRRRSLPAPDGPAQQGHAHSLSLSYLSACGGAGAGPSTGFSAAGGALSAGRSLGAPVRLSTDAERSTTPVVDLSHDAREEGADDGRPPRRRQRTRDSVESFTTAPSDDSGGRYGSLHPPVLPPLPSSSSTHLVEFGSPGRASPSALGERSAAARMTGTFGPGPVRRWAREASEPSSFASSLDASAASDDDDADDGGERVPALRSAMDSLAGFSPARNSARTTGGLSSSSATDARLSVASRFTATSRVTSLSPSTFSSADLHAHETAVISRAVVFSSQQAGDEARVGGKSLRLTVFAPAFAWPVDADGPDGGGAARKDDDDDDPPLSASQSSLAYSASSLDGGGGGGPDDDDDDAGAQDGADALDQAVQMFRARSVDNLRALASTGAGGDEPHAALGAA